jgi:hypothetical protein
MRLEFTVHGEPKPQGAKKAFVIPKLGRAVMVEANAGLKPWRDSVIAAASEVVEREEIGQLFPLEDFVKVFATFYFARPATHLR